MQMKTTANGLMCAALLSSLMIAVTFSPAKSQTIIEMSALKCGDYLQSPPVRQEQYAAWMSGYFNAARNMPMVDLKRFATNKRLVEKYCRGHKNDNLMNVIRKVAI
jgi:HdeA/HdeB family protein